MTSTPDFHSFDRVVVNSSAGKDSQAMLTTLVEMADAQGYDRSKMVVVHADLGRVEWKGTAELAETQAAFYGLRFVKVSRPQGDLLDEIVQRRESLDRQADDLARQAATLQAEGRIEEAYLAQAKSVEKRIAPAFPSSEARYCTSDQKTGQVAKVLTALAKEVKAEGLDRPARILNCLGLRAQESPARAKKPVWSIEKKATNGQKTVTRWLPIFEMTVDEVWATIERSGVPFHPAYEAGMPRLSCCFCVLASKGALVRAAQLNPALADEYRQVEIRVRSRFTDALSMADIIEAARTSSDPVPADDWAA